MLPKLAQCGDATVEVWQRALRNKEEGSAFSQAVRRILAKEDFKKKRGKNFLYFKEKKLEHVDFTMK